MSNVTREPYSGALLYTSTPEEERIFKEKQESKNLIKRVSKLEDELNLLKKILIDNKIIKI